MRWLGLLGCWVRLKFSQSGEVLGLLGLTVLQIPNLLNPAKLNVFWMLFKRQLYNTGFKAAYVNCAIASFLGIGLANQILLYLQKVESFADIFVLVVVRELAPIVSGIILIARSATAVTAEIGYLQLSDEFEVLRSQGVNPIFMFILPVLFAFPLSLLIMLIYFNLVTMMACWLYIDLFTLNNWSMGQFFYAITDRISLGELLISGLKAVVGGAAVGFVCLYSGYRVGDRFTDISRTISSGTTTLLFLYFAICIGLSVVVY